MVVGSPSSNLRIDRNARSLRRAHNGTMQLLSIGLHERSRRRALELPDPRLEKTNAPVVSVLRGGIEDAIQPTIAAIESELPRDHIPRGLQDRVLLFEATNTRHPEPLGRLDVVSERSLSRCSG